MLVIILRAEGVWPCDVTNSLNRSSSTSNDKLPTNNVPIETHTHIHHSTVIENKSYMYYIHECHWANYINRTLLSVPNTTHWCVCVCVYVCVCVCVCVCTCVCVFNMEIVKMCIQCSSLRRCHLHFFSQLAFSLACYML